MKRYKDYKDNHSDCFCAIEEDQLGDYVLYEDAMEEISKLEKQIETLDRMNKMQSKHNQELNNLINGK